MCFINSTFIGKSCVEHTTADSWIYALQKQTIFSIMWVFSLVTLEWETLNCEKKTAAVVGCI